MKIIERAVAAPAAIDHSRVEFQQFDVAYRAPGQVVRSAQDAPFLATYTSHAQPDGSTLLTDRVDGEFESGSPDLSWTQMRRIGGDGHAYVAFSDGKSAYTFLTRHPEGISRRPANEDEKRPGASLLRGLAEELLKFSQRAESVRWRGREVTHGALCDVIDLVLREDPKDLALKWGDLQVTYYVGVKDGLIDREVEAQGPPERRSYTERLYTIDPTFKAADISYSRFEVEVKRLLHEKPLPPIVRSP